MKYRAYFSALGAAALGLTFSIQGVSAQERLSFSSMSPAGSPNSKFYNAWAERINKAGGGSVQVVVRDGTTIANTLCNVQPIWMTSFTTGSKKMSSRSAGHCTACWAASSR